MIAVTGFPLRGNRLPYSPSFLAVRPYGGVHRPFAQFPRFRKMTAIRLGVGCQPKSPVFILRLACIPLLLLRHCIRVRPRKGKSVESTVEYEIIQFLPLRLADDLPRLVGPLQGQEVVGEIDVKSDLIGCQAHALPRNLSSFFIPPLLRVYYAQIAVPSPFSWVALNLLLIRLGRSIQLSG